MLVTDGVEVMLRIDIINNSSNLHLIKMEEVTETTGRDLMTGTDLRQIDRSNAISTMRGTDPSNFLHWNVRGEVDLATVILCLLLVIDEGWTVLLRENVRRMVTIG
jgi:hypothetical protein